MVGGLRERADRIRHRHSAAGFGRGSSECVEISGNGFMALISGLNGLVQVGGDLSLMDVSSLARVTGMSQLASVGGEVYLSNNGLLTDIPGLFPLTSVGGDFVLYFNPVLADCSPLIPLLDPIDDPPPGATAQLGEPAHRWITAPGR